MRADAAGPPRPKTAAVVALGAGGSVTPSGDVSAFGRKAAEARTAVEFTPLGVGLAGRPLPSWAFVRSVHTTGVAPVPAEVLARAGAVVVLFRAVLGGLSRAALDVVTVDGTSPVPVRLPGGAGEAGDGLGMPGLGAWIHGHRLLVAPGREYLLPAPGACSDRRGRGVAGVGTATRGRHRGRGRGREAWRHRSAGCGGAGRPFLTVADDAGALAVGAGPAVRGDASGPSPRSGRVPRAGRTGRRTRHVPVSARAGRGAGRRGADDCRGGRVRRTRSHRTARGTPHPTPRPGERPPGTPDDGRPPPSPRGRSPAQRSRCGCPAGKEPV
ncbi:MULTISPECIES: streptophobe family protein [Streptomyces]|uniref:streptophobe family protein n=1 Tax=Streptomyces TaxID=1883 RepID=UPI00288A579C|nr:streptophobe family protein [Streptomyces sp. EAS-AB2608]